MANKAAGVRDIEGVRELANWSHGVPVKMKCPDWACGVEMSLVVWWRTGLVQGAAFPTPCFDFYKIEDYSVHLDGCIFTKVEKVEDMEERARILVGLIATRGPGEEDQN